MNKVMTLATLKEYKRTSYQFGVSAENTGKTPVAHHDADFNTWFYSLNLPICKEATAILKSWNNGWWDMRFKKARAIQMNKN